MRINIDTAKLTEQALLPMPFTPISGMTRNEAMFKPSKTVASTKRWVAHVSDKTQLVSDEELVLQLSPTVSFNAFDIIEKLLFAKTCRIIHTDAVLSLNQIAFLQEMALFSGTDLVFIGNKDMFNRKQMFSLEEA